MTFKIRDNETNETEKKTASGELIDFDCLLNLIFVLFAIDFSLSSK